MKRDSFRASPPAPCFWASHVVPSGRISPSTSNPCPQRWFLPVSFGFLRRGSHITQVGLKWPRGLAVNNCKEEAKLHQPKGLLTRLFSSSSSGESLALMWIRTQLQALQAQQAEEGIMNTAAWQILPGLNLIISLIFYYEMTYHSVRNAMWAHTKIKLRIIFLLE